MALFDTAGRQDIDEELLKELKAVASVVQPSETLLVADAATGQQAVGVAQRFNEAVGVTGLVMSKLEGVADGVQNMTRSFTGEEFSKLLGPLTEVVHRGRW